MSIQFGNNQGCISELQRLLGFLNCTQPTEPVTWKEWSISPVSGGANNKPYRATSSQHDLAIKFTIAGERDRAGREFRALSALYELGLTIAPEPILLDKTSWSQPLVVQTWLEGNVKDLPPQTDDEWTLFINHMKSIHSVTPDRISTQLPEAVHTAYDARQAFRLIEDQFNRVPLEHHSPQARTLIETIRSQTLPEWERPAATLSRCDPAIRNFLRLPDRWLSVDWENSGWGDPAFEIAGMMTHPSYEMVDERRWEWVIAIYCQNLTDPECERRIRTYRQLSLAWWVGRFERMLYEIPRQLDERHVPRPATWQMETQRSRDHYAKLALARH